MLKIEFKTSNAAFHPSADDGDDTLDTYAVADTISAVAQTIRDTARTEGTILDFNGNVVGSWSLSTPALVERTYADGRGIWHAVVTGGTGDEQRALARAAIVAEIAQREAGDWDSTGMSVALVRDDRTHRVFAENWSPS